MNFDLKKLGLFILLLIFLVTVVKTAWVSDDAYITFRTVDNFVNGHGLTWNTDERVQAFSNPLWMFVMSGVYFFTREISITSLLISVLFSLVAVSIFAFKIAKSENIALLGLSVLLVSKAFVDFSTSGLENPLSYFLLAVFFWVYFKFELNEKALFYLSLLSALLALNHLDLIVLCLPVLAVVFWNLKNKAAVKAVVIGFVPLVLWELFSLWYYGFLFPNTAYAKLSSGIPLMQLVNQGVLYFVDSLTRDSITLLVIFISLILACLSREKRHLPVVAGIVIYLIYLVSIGGDFMSGRFFAPVFLIAVFLLSQFELPQLDLKLVFASVICLFTLSLLIPFGSFHETLNDCHSINGIDERACYYTYANLISALSGNLIPGSNETIRGLLLHEELKGYSAGQYRVIIYSVIGAFGFYAGPKAHIVDLWALADPFLARLPARRDNWRIGHFERKVPEGYFERLQSKGVINDPDLALYYSKLLILTRGNLFDTNRLMEIWNFNTGKYDYLIRKHCSRNSCY